MQIFLRSVCLLFKELVSFSMNSPGGFFVPHFIYLELECLHFISFAWVYPAFLAAPLSLSLKFMPEQGLTLSIELAGTLWFKSWINCEDGI